MSEGLLKTCKTCGLEKAPAEFPPSGRLCKLCKNAAVKARRAARTEAQRAADHRLRNTSVAGREGAKRYQKTEKGRAKARRGRLMHEYGITQDTFEMIEAKQGGVCMLCGVVPEKLYIDHDHSTRQVRGLLCRSCNTALGMFRENPDVMRLAAIYIETWAAFYAHTGEVVTRW